MVRLSASNPGSQRHGHSATTATSTMHWLFLTADDLRPSDLGHIANHSNSRSVNLSIGK